ncbi:MAG: restriction endonuclease [Kiritimatiellia bacterium]
MSDRITFIELARLILAQTTEPLTPDEVWQRACQTGLVQRLGTTGKTPVETLSARLYTSVKKPGSPFLATNDRPKRFQLNPDSATSAPAQSQPPPSIPAPSPEPLEPTFHRYSFLDCAYKVLDQIAAKHPMHYRQITQLALDRGWLQTTGNTPDATLYAQILTDIRRCRERGEKPRFVKHGKGLVGLTSWDGNGVDSVLEKHYAETRRKLKEKLLKLPPGDFEELVSRLLFALGFTDVIRTRLSGDGGVDVLGKISGAGGTLQVRLAVQAKRWKHNVQAPTVQQIRGSLGAHDQGCIVTTSDFSKGAREEAQRSNCTPITLINGDDLVNLLLEKQIGVRRESVPVYTIRENILSAPEEDEE